MGSPPDLFAFYYKEVFTGKEVVYNKKYHFTQGENNEGESMENVIAVLIIALALMAGGINVSAASGITIRQGKVYQNNKVYTGWFSQNNGSIIL